MSAPAAPPLPPLAARSTSPSRRAAAGSVLAAALLAGPITGWLHAGCLAVERVLLGHFTWYSREFIWMAPVAYTLCFLVASVPLLVCAALRPSMVSRGVPAGYMALLGAFGLLLPYPQVSRLASLVLAAGIALQVARMAGRGGGWWARYGTRLMVAQFAVVGATALLQPVARGLRERRAVAALAPAPAGAPNVLVLILDTVRASSLSLYGFPFPTTPHIATWAAQGTTFDWAIAPAPWTLPSHASIFTGQYPAALSTNWTVPLDPRTPVLTEAFRAQGYYTVAVVANHDYTAFDSGLQRGFAHFEDYLVSWSQLISSTTYTQTSLVRGLLGARSWSDLTTRLQMVDLSIDPKHDGDPRRASSVTARFLAWQQTHTGRPFFAFLNYFDAHQGYYAPPGFPPILSPKGKRYHTAIAWVDQNVGELLTQLQRRGVLDNTVVVIASDHGELFAEHGLNGHANNLYQNVLRVPLVIRFPGTVPAGQRIQREVSLRDLAATIADLGGLATAAFPGTSLRHAWLGDTTALSPVLATVRKAPNVDPSFPTARGDMAALFDATRHYVWNAGGGEELFKYRIDSLEATDLAKRDTIEIGVMRTRLQALLREYTPDERP